MLNENLLRHSSNTSELLCVDEAVIEKVRYERMQEMADSRQ